MIEKPSETSGDEPLVPELREVADELRGQTAEVESFLADLSAEQLNWQPEPTRWSAAQHVAHLGTANRIYLEAMEDPIRTARREGRTGAGPYRHPLLARFLAWSLRPPVRLRIKASDRLVPESRHGKEEVLDGFRAVQDDVLEAMRAASGLDLGRVRFPSPFASWVRMSLGTAFDAIAAHNDRHLWHARRVLAAPEFPG